MASRRTIPTSLSLLTPSVHISLTYNNSLTDFVVLEEYRFQSLKPFDIAFSRTQLSHNRFIVNSTITNRLATDMMLTNVAFSVASSRVRQVYTSFDSAVSVHTDGKYIHFCILEVDPEILQKGAILGSLAIHFIAKGHKEIGLTSTKVTIPNISRAQVQGYYEVDKEFTLLEPKSIFAVLTNVSNHIQVVSLDWSNMKGSIQVVGECCFNKLIQPGKTTRIELQYLDCAWL